MWLRPLATYSFAWPSGVVSPPLPPPDGPVDPIVSIQILDASGSHDESRQLNQARQTVKVLFYGRLAESIAAEVDVDARPGCSVGELRERLIAAYPQAEKPLRSSRSRACVGDSLVQEDHVLDGFQSVGFLPPVSGG